MSVFKAETRGLVILANFLSVTAFSSPLPPPTSPHESAVVSSTQQRWRAMSHLPQIGKYNKNKYCEWLQCYSEITKQG